VDGIRLRSRHKYVGTVDTFLRFYAIVCIDYFLVGLFLNRRSQTLGPKVLAIGGLVLSGSLGFKASASIMGWGADDIYAPGIDQYVMIAGQFIAITLVNIGFLRIFLDLRQQKNLVTERNLAAAKEHATLLSRHKKNCRNCSQSAKKSFDSSLYPTKPRAWVCWSLVWPMS